MLNPLARFATQVRSWPRGQRELAIAAAALLGGAVLMPVLVWVAGRIALGNYANGGPLALLGDFMRGLAQGAMPFWIVAAAPYVALLLARGLLAAFARIGRDL
jgi:hypothetical protein